VGVVYPLARIKEATIEVKRKRFRKYKAFGTNDRIVLAINSMGKRSLWTISDLVVITRLNRRIFKDLLTYYRREGFIIPMGKESFQYLYRRTSKIPKAYMTGRKR